MKKPLESCVNGDGNPVQLPSWVLCKECFAKLDQQWERLAERLGMERQP